MAGPQKGNNFCNHSFSEAMCFHRGLVLSNALVVFFLNRFVTPKRGNPIRRISVPIFQMAWLG